MKKRMPVGYSQAGSGGVQGWRGESWRRGGQQVTLIHTPSPTFAHSWPPICAHTSLTCILNVFTHRPHTHTLKCTCPHTPSHTYVFTATHVLAYKHNMLTHTHAAVTLTYAYAPLHMHMHVHVSTATHTCTHRLTRSACMLTHSSLHLCT